MRPEENLRLYCSKAVLQKIPPPPDVPFPQSDGFAWGLNLYTIVDPRRDLSYIYSVGDVFDQRVLNYQKYIPDDPLDAPEPSAMERIIIPAGAPFNIPPGMFGDDFQHPIEAIRSAVSLAALVTLRRIVHLVSPRSKPFTVQNATSSGDIAQRMALLTWADGKVHSNTLNAPRPDCRTAFFVFEPWTLADDDFQLFTKQKKVRNSVRRDGYISRDFQHSDRLWGMIHDRCYRLGCRWFVVTTYNKWAFGVFSKGWTSAFITPPKPYDSVEPTILQCLVFWIQSSMDCSGKWDIDEVALEDADFFARLNPFSIPPSISRVISDAAAVDGVVSRDPTPSNVDPVEPRGRALFDSLLSPSMGAALGKLPGHSPEKMDQIALWRGTLIREGKKKAEVEDVDDIRSQTSGAGPSMTNEERTRLRQGSA